MSFTNEADCDTYMPHKLKPNICCNCNKLLAKHAKDCEGVTDDAILRALEFGGKGESFPSVIIPPTPTRGGLYHGGFRSALNFAVLESERIGAVVNAAKGLEVFGPKV
jgi:hypothetical protein